MPFTTVSLSIQLRLLFNVHVNAWLLVVRRIPSFCHDCDFQELIHHQSHGNALALHLVQRLSSPHLEVPQATSLRLLEQQNLGKLFLLLRAMLPSV